MRDCIGIDLHRKFIRVAVLDDEGREVVNRRLEVIERLSGQIRRLEGALRRQLASGHRVDHLTTLPGVGRLTAWFSEVVWHMPSEGRACRVRGKQSRVGSSAPVTVPA
ncbi:MAG: hypothetical protein GWP05_04925 [Anaerolineaceae bacterium]|nr:hypothetical protein [Anaerolineaceae bacterium]